jgi:chorismate mutase
MIFNPNQLKKPLVIAGPCSAESQEQMLTTAKSLSKDVSIFRAGVWKPRTRPNSFEGVGAPALEWLKEVQSQTHLKVATEVATPEHVEKCLEANIDVLWIGARTTVNPFYVQEIAQALKGVDVTVMVKNPLHPELSLWMGAIERLMMVGVKDIAAIHRGFFTLEQSVFRNEPKWELAIKLKRMHPDLAIICDPSHISGSPTMIKEVSQTAMDLNMDGLMIETHFNPKIALSDAQQQITPDQLNHLIQSLVLRTEVAQNQDFNSQLDVIRQKIDAIDNELISTIGKRTELVKEIGRFKKQNGVTILQIQRWFEIIKTRQDWANSKEIDKSMVSELFELIHKHSVLLQTHIMNQNNDD